MAHQPGEGAHRHRHEPANFGRAFAVGVALNTGFVVVEAAYGLAAHSLALLADAGHNLSDVPGLLLAWGAATLSRSAPTPRRTYGLRRPSILAALFNALLLQPAVGGIAWDAFGRLRETAPVVGRTAVWVALVGIGIDGLPHCLFFQAPSVGARRSEGNSGPMRVDDRAGSGRASAVGVVRRVPGGFE